MNKVAHYLQEHLTGEVITASDVRKYFSTDTSVLEVMPAIVAYPRNENDVRKTARFTWQLAERGRVIPITARGSGTDPSGGAIGPGIILVFPAHMNKVLELDTRSGAVTVEPGLNYAKLQQALHTHGRFLPPFPASMEYSTIGGAIGNNASGEKTVKYGNTRNFVDAMRVVLANGEVIETKRINKRELNKKMGLSTFEGEIYRSLDAVIEENYDVIQGMALDVSKNSAGYDLASVKQKDGSLDLTPLFVGSQGTLGIVTEAVIATEPYNPTTTLIAGLVTDLTQATEIVLQLRKMSKGPSAVEIVDEHLLSFVQEHNPNQLKGIIKPPFPKLVMLVEFDDSSAKIQKKNAKKVVKMFGSYGIQCKVETEPYKQEELWKIRHSAASVIAHNKGNARAVPIIEDGIVPLERFEEYLANVYEMFNKHKLQVSIWGHAGNANIHMQPFLDLSQLGDRQLVFRLIEDYYTMVIKLGGSTSGEHNDGRIRAPYLEKLYGHEAYEVFKKVKAVFDPYGILNSGVKMDVTLEDIKPLLRNEYSVSHLADHMPRT
ncbi:MAG: FAD-binding oxidoreductase [Candidatus Saccharimonadales bacterium]